MYDLISILLDYVEALPPPRTWTGYPKRAFPSCSGCIS